MLTKARKTDEVLCNAMRLTRQGEAAAQLYCGGLGAFNSAGKLVPASDAAGLRVAGIVQRDAAIGETAKLVSGVHILNNSATHPLDNSMLNNLCYVEDDQTASSDPGSNAVKAGVFRGLDPHNNGVIVESGNLRET